MAKLLTLVLIFSALLFCFARENCAQTTEFTYQGSLKDNAAPANGNYDFEFALFDALTAGNQIGSTIPKNNVPVANGIFSVRLDFGSVFPGANRYLEIRVRLTAQPGFTALSPRQLLNSAPYAVKSFDAAQLGGLAANTYLQTNGDGSQLTNLNGANLINNSVGASALAGDTFPNIQNLSRVALLRWDLLLQKVTVGTGALFDAFDGVNIWVANNGAGTVTKVRVSDGSVQGTFGVGTAPAGVVYDGTNIWVANNGSNNVTRLRASDGAPQGTFPVGTSPFGMVFDGVAVWVVNNGSNNVTKLRASDGALQGTFAVGMGPRGAAFDGTNIWVTNSSVNTATKLRASDGAFVATLTLMIFPYGITFDGANMWITSNNSGPGGTGEIGVTKIRVSDGVRLGGFPAGNFPNQSAFDGTNIWVASGTSNTVHKLRASDGATLATYSLGANPFGVAFDGSNIWVTNAGDKLTKLPAFP